MLTFSLALLFAGCGGDWAFWEKKTGGSVSTHIVGTKGNVVSALSGGGASVNSLIGPVSSLIGSIPAQASTAQLESLKYRVETIEICKSIQISETGTGLHEGCIRPYNNTSADCSDRSYADAAADKTNFVDLMDPIDRLRLDGAITLTEDDVGTYKYGVIGWCYQIKVKATVPTVDGSKTLYTKPGSRVEVDGWIGTRVDDLTVGPAQEGIMEHNNGGSFFIFQKPFLITDKDIDEKTNFSLDLVFNPEYMVTGHHSEKPGPGTSGNFFESTPADCIPYSDDNCLISNEITVPLLRLTPVLRTEDDSVEKETYMFHVREPDHIFDIRVELYYLASDPSKAIYGIDAKSIFTEESTQFESDPPTPFGVGTSGEDTLVLSDYTGRAYLTFTRLSTVGAAPAKATFHCFYSQDSGFSIGGTCPKADVPIAYELAAISTISK